MTHVFILTQAMGSLEELQMPQNGILHEGITALADALASNTNLRLLNMNDNTFTEAGAKAMAKVIPVKKALADSILLSISVLLLVFAVTISLSNNSGKSYFVVQFAGFAKPTKLGGTQLW